MLSYRWKESSGPWPLSYDLYDYLTHERRLRDINDFQFSKYTLVMLVVMYFKGFSSGAFSGLFRWQNHRVQTLDTDTVTYTLVSCNESGKIFYGFKNFALLHSITSVKFITTLLEGQHTPIAVNWSVCLLLKF